MCREESVGSVGESRGKPHSHGHIGRMELHRTAARLPRSYSQDLFPKKTKLQVGFRHLTYTKYVIVKMINSSVLSLLIK